MVPLWMSIPLLVLGVALLIVAVTGVGGRRGAPVPPTQRVTNAVIGVVVSAQAAGSLGFIPLPLQLAISFVEIIAFSVLILASILRRAH